MAVARKSFLLFFVSLLPVSLAGAVSGPYLAFSDLTSGPNTGNTDTSQGQTAGANGAILSVWGLNLGSSQGSSSISVNGTKASVIYYWGNAVPPWSPANLNNGYQNMQMVIFQVPSTAATGTGSISATVNGAVSNTLPYAVTRGRFFFVAPNGSDTNPGTFQSPLATIEHAAAIMANQPGDIIYVENGVNATAGNLDCGQPQAVCFPGNSGTASQPISLVSFPGASVQLGTTGTLNMTSSGLMGVGLETGGGVKASYITVAKFKLFGGVQAIIPRNGTRVVGNTISCPNGNSDQGCLQAEQGSNVYILGNEAYNAGLICAPAGPGTCPGGDSLQLYHTFYITGGRGYSGPSVTDSNRYIEWNYLHDNNANRAIHVYQECFSGTCDTLTTHHVDHNVVVNQNSDCIDFNGVDGEHWAYDNLCIKTGLGPDFNGNPTQHFAFELRSVPPGSLFHVYNNTFYDSGCTMAGCGDSNTSTGVVNLCEGQCANPAGVDFHNNVAYQDSTFGVVSKYISLHNGFTTQNASESSNNLWFGSGAAPTFDSNSINSDPNFFAAGSNFRLQSGSPAIGSGSGLGSTFVTSDMDGTPQPSHGAYDLGPYALPEENPTRASPAPATPVVLRWQ